MKKEVIRHLKSDKAMFKREAAEDEKLIKRMSKKHKEHEAAEKKAGYSEAMEHSKSKSKKKAKGKSKAKMKIAKVMDEFKKGELHSGKGGPVVKKPKQAIAIAISVSKKKRK